QITAALTDPATTVEVLDLAPAPGTEGTNYSLNKTGASAMGIDLDLMFKEAISATGRDMVQGMGDIIVECPTLTDIETFIGDRVHQEVVARSFMGVWTPETPEGSPVTINDLRPKALADALAIGINAGAGADENLLERFISPDQAMGIALDGAFVIETIGDIINRPESEGGFGGIPRDFSNIEGHDARLNTLNWELRNGAIHFSGDVTVFDVFCGADADCTFWADIGLRWLPPDASGRQTLEPFMIDHDVDLPWWAWLLAVLGFIFGLILGVIAIVITVVVENIAERVGGAVMEDEVSGQLQTIGAWPQQLQGIGTVETTFQEDVLIEPSGLMFAVNYTGSITVTATYALTLVFPAQAGGPYSGPAGMPIDFFAVPNPKATHQWDFGDGHTATGNHVSHTYEDDGLYIARLTTTVLETGGATTHHSVAVRMQNVPPVVDAGPDIVVDEGQEFSLRGSFSDQEWKDTHEAVWIFGDDTLPETGIVTENNDPPRAEGVVTGSHAYCDSGEFSVTLRVRDDDGGVSEDTLKVTVRNVAPTVEAGDYVFAYPCTPITLVAHFTDPGWCDTHTAVWDFGDCTPPMPATVREVNEPPEAYGIAAATHTYNSCGTYLAKCTVTDDDGGTTEDTVVVHAIHVLNRDFEGGFRNRLAGTVANAWEPYIANEGVAGAIAASDQPSGKAGISFFKAEEFVVHSGQRSQCITGAGNFRAGIYQKVGANPDWDYQVSVWYHLDERAGGACRLGIDPTGGNDPASADIEWTKGNKHRNWAQLVRRVTAEGHNITIFLEAVSEDRGTAAFFDDVTLAPYPCPLEEPEKPEEQPSEPKE
ncbi:MAG: PKD domain-containing protein, partial [Gammaproteobacteria bacterium]|nr:PKD domain-containing protein [Gammaproteobacteria bacterium]